VRLEGEGKLVRVFIGDSDRWEGRSLSGAIVERAKREGLAGTTVIHGIAGFGASSRLHTARILRLSQDLPLIVEIVDTEEQIERFLPILDEMVDDGLVTVEKAHVISYRGTLND